MNTRSQGRRTPVPVAAAAEAAQAVVNNDSHQKQAEEFLALLFKNTPSEDRMSNVRTGKNKAAQNQAIASFLDTLGSLGK